MYHELKNKTVLITGGTGSFGIGFIKLLLEESTVQMIKVYSRDEHKQEGLRRIYPQNKRISFYIGDIRDKERLSRVLEETDWVVHAAALKQSPLGEIEGQEFVKTNIQGTINLIESCLDKNIDKCLLISSDKAVEPINLYGATKMVAEKLFLQANRMRGTKKTKFSLTRYGNVAMTNGSVIPKFQSLGGDTVPICKDATRFWITLEQASKFVLDSLINMRGNEVFIPEMKSVKIEDIAAAVCPDKVVLYIPLRPGDKLHETILPGRTSLQNDFITVQEIKDYVNGNKQASKI